MQSVLETSHFTRRADALLTRDERMELIATLAANPLAIALSLVLAIRRLGADRERQ